MGSSKGKRERRRARSPPRTAGPLGSHPGQDPPAPPSISTGGGPDPKASDLAQEREEEERKDDKV